MYLELLETELGVQGALASAYFASGRSREIGMLALATNSVARAFFEKVEPPVECVELHQSFLRWQELGIDALAEELKENPNSDTDLERRFAAAAEHFHQALEAFMENAKKVETPGGSENGTSSSHLASQIVSVLEELLQHEYAVVVLNFDSERGYYMQYLHRQGEIYCETVSNTFLADEHKLGPAQITRLEELGWAAPTDNSSANWHWMMEGTPDLGVIARLTVSTLEVYRLGRSVSAVRFQKEWENDD
jgi:hypothetical protein